MQVLKENFMVGSYAPKMELQTYTTPVEEAPTGMWSFIRFSYFTFCNDSVK